MVRTRRRSKKEGEEREKWEMILKAMKKMLRNQQSEVESLSEQRDCLRHRIILQRRAWLSDLSLLHSHISELRRKLDLPNLANSLLLSKSRLLLSSTQSHAFASHLKSEHAVRELADFKACFDILSHPFPHPQDVPPACLYEFLSSKRGLVSSPGSSSEQHPNILENQVATLKREYEKLSLKNSAEVSSLRAEIKFAWNQYNEKDITSSTRLQAMSDELNQANLKIMALVARLEQLESEKDQTVSTLRATISRLEDEARLKDEMITSCSKELDMLKSNRPIGIPTLKRCSAEPSSSTSKRRSCSRNEKSLRLEQGQASAHLDTAAATLKDKLNKLEVEARLPKELSLLRSKTSASTPVLGQCTSEPSSRLRSQVNGSSKTSAVRKQEASQLASEKGGKRTKRKQEDIISMEDTPRLFTSQFKIPKLKSQSPRKR
ncbi:hypothetical protein vseg_012621 [Gypsophila vaccaria]